MKMWALLRSLGPLAMLVAIVASIALLTIGLAIVGGAAYLVARATDAALGTACAPRMGDYFCRTCFAFGMPV